MPVVVPGGEALNYIPPTEVSLWASAYSLDMELMIAIMRSRTWRLSSGSSDPEWRRKVREETRLNDEAKYLTALRVGRMFRCHAEDQGYVIDLKAVDPDIGDIRMAGHHVLNAIRRTSNYVGRPDLFRVETPLDRQFHLELGEHVLNNIPRDRHEIPPFEDFMSDYIQHQ